MLGFVQGYVFHLQLQSFSNSAPQTLSNIVKAVSETENMMLVLDWGDIPMYTKIYYTLSNLSMEDIPVYITMYIIHFQISVWGIYMFKSQFGGAQGIPQSWK